METVESASEGSVDETDSESIAGGRGHDRRARRFMPLQKDLYCFQNLLRNLAPIAEGRRISIH